MSATTKAQLSDRDVLHAFQSAVQDGSRVGASGAENLNAAEAKAALHSLYLPFSCSRFDELVSSSAAASPGSNTEPERQTDGAGPAVATQQEPLQGHAASTAPTQRPSETEPVLGYNEFRLLVRHGEQKRRALFDEVDANHDGEWTRE